MGGREQRSPSSADRRSDVNSPGERHSDGGEDAAVVRLGSTDRTTPTVYELVDSIEEVTLPVAVERAPDQSAAPRAERVDATDRFPAPVDGCWRVDAATVTPLCTADVYVRSPDNTVVATATAEAPARVPTGPHVLELSTAPVKTYVAVDGPARVSYQNRYPTVSVVGATAGDGRLLLAARSRRTSPAGTVTVPDSPAGLARAVSTFGSAMATTSPERSFPTLRGHPPLLERGAEFATPRFVERVDEGVVLGLPFEYDALYSATPLAFYLTAEIVESEEPYLRVGDVRHDLPHDRESLAVRLGELLRHCFTLDCATRACAAGLYDVDLHVHETLTERLDPPWEEWYEAPLPERTAAYLNVPTEATLDCLDWPQTTDVTPASENATVLPFLAADLSVVRSPPPRSAADGDEVGELDDFVRSSGDVAREASFTRDASDAAFPRGPTQNGGDNSETVVTPEPADSIAQSWVGPGYPMGGAKPTVEAYSRRLDRTPAEDLTIGVTVVCNDEAMVEELGDTYGFRDHVTFDIREERDLTVAALRDLLGDDHDFFHYVGHVDERGMQCADGFLDLQEIGETGVKAFLLNACTSYRQGMALVEAGALGGIVSLTDLPNSLATQVGRDLARLFDAGFPLYAALDVVGTGPFAGNAYSIVGDPLVQLCQCANGAAMVIETESDKAKFSLKPRYYPTERFGVGSMANPYFGGSDSRFIASGSGIALDLSHDEMADFLNISHSPLEVQNKIYWPGQIDFDRLCDITGPP